VLLLATQIFLLAPPKKVLASELQNRSLQVINPLPSAITTYEFRFDTTTAGNIGSILFEFCSNSPVYGATCVAPNGFSASSATIASQGGVSGFSLGAGQPNNQILLSRPPSFVNSPVSASLIFDNIVNTTDTGSSYVRISTYASSDGTGASTDQGGIAYAITNALDISTEVPQFLEFCTGLDIGGFNCTSTSGDSIDFGDFSPATTATGTSEFMAATNASYGYNVILNGTTLTSGNNVIPAASGAASTVGNSQFGLNLRANNTPLIGNDPQGPGNSVVTSAYDQPDHYRFSSGDTLVSANDSDNYHKFTVSYIANVSKTQAAGDYASTMFFICLANF
jgi:hypothetical protein